MIHSSLLYTSQLHAYCKHLCCWNDWRYNSFIWFKNSDRWKREGEGCEALFPPEFHKQIFGFILELSSVNGLTHCPGVYSNNYMGNFQTCNPNTGPMSASPELITHPIPGEKAEGKATKRQLLLSHHAPCTESRAIPFRSVGPRIPATFPTPHVPYSTSALNASLRSKHPVASCQPDRLSVRLRHAGDGAYPWNKPATWPHFHPSGLRMVGTNIATRCCAQQCSKNWKAVCMANSERSHFSVELWPVWYYVDLFLYLCPDLHFCFTAAHKVLNFCTPIWQVYNIPGDFRYRLAYQQGSPPQTPRYHYLTAFIYGTTL